MKGLRSENDLQNRGYQRDMRVNMLETLLTEKTYWLELSTAVRIPVQVPKNRIKILPNLGGIGAIRKTLSSRAHGNCFPQRRSSVCPTMGCNEKAVGKTLEPTSWRALGVNK